MYQEPAPRPLEHARGIVPGERALEREVGLDLRALLEQPDPQPYPIAPECEAPAEPPAETDVYSALGLSALSSSPALEALELPSLASGTSGTGPLPPCSGANPPPEFTRSAAGRGVPEMSLLPEAIRDRFQVEQELGRGSMGVVYRAHDLLLDRPVALKVLFPVRGRPEERALLEERLVREARLAARLHDPHIMIVHDILHADNEWVLVLELVEGQTLRERLLREEELPVGRVVHWLIQSARALNAAHSAGVIHRDIKPENVMLQAGDRIKLMDFGVALGPDTPRLTVVGQAMGTPAYLAPEMLAGAVPSPKTDLFALGVMAYELLRGENPYVGGDVMQVLGRIHHLRPPPLAEVCADVPEGLSRVVQRLMAADPEVRYGSAAELGLDLEALRIPLHFGNAVGLDTLSQHRAASEPQRTALEPLPSPASVETLSEQIRRIAFSPRGRKIVLGVASSVVVVGGFLWGLLAPGLSEHPIGPPSAVANSARAVPENGQTSAVPVSAVPASAVPVSAVPVSAVPASNGGVSGSVVPGQSVGMAPSMTAPAAQPVADKVPQPDPAVLLSSCLHKRSLGEQLRCSEPILKRWPEAKPIPPSAQKAVQQGIETPELRTLAVRVAVYALPKAPLVSRMEHLLDSSDSDTRDLAIQTLGRLGKPVSQAERSRHALKDEECPTRREAALYFRSHPYKKAKDDLQAAFGRSYFIVEKQQTGLFGFNKKVEKEKRTNCDHEALREALEQLK